MIKRRSAIEPAIEHMKMDGRLGRNPLKGALGDALHAVPCGAGHDLRLILAALRMSTDLPAARNRIVQGGLPTARNAGHPDWGIS